jgi:hypothetical protein
LARSASIHDRCKAVYGQSAAVIGLGQQKQKNGLRQQGSAGISG